MRAHTGGLVTATVRVCSALTVLVGVQFLGLSNTGYFMFTVALVLVWAGYALVVIREHRNLTNQADAQETRPDAA